MSSRPSKTKKKNNSDRFIPYERPTNNPITRLFKPVSKDKTVIVIDSDEDDSSQLSEQIPAFDEPFPKAPLVITQKDGKPMEEVPAAIFYTPYQEEEEYESAEPSFCFSASPEQPVFQKDSEQYVAAMLDAESIASVKPFLFLSENNGSIKPIQLLESMYPHPNDSRIRFEEEQHKYYLDGSCEGMTSVSGLYRPYWMEFDPDAAIDVVRARFNAARNRYGDDIIALKHLPEKYSMYYLLTDDEIKDFWKANGKQAADSGTYGHLQAELFCNGVAYDFMCAGLQHVRQFFYDHPWYRPVRTEWSIYYPLAMLAGQIDITLRDLRDPEPNNVILGDWKFAEVDDEYYCSCPWKQHDPQNSRCPAFGTHPLTKAMPNSSKSHYFTQLNLYRMIIYLGNYQLNVTNMLLLPVKGTQEKYNVIPVPVLEQLARAMIEERINSLETQRNVAARIKQNPQFLLAGRA